MTYAMIQTTDVPKVTGDPATLSDTTSIKTAGSTVSTKTGDIVTEWGKLTDENYNAPEAPAVKQAMGKITSPATTIKTNLSTISTAVNTAGGTLATLKTRSTTLTEDVTEFVTRANDMQEFVKAGGSMEGEKWSTWRDVPGLSEENDGLWQRATQLQTDIDQVETDLISDLAAVYAPDPNLPTPSWTAGIDAGTHAEVSGPGASAYSYSGYTYDGKNHKWVAGAEAEAHLFQANAVARADNGPWGSGEAGASVDVGARASAQVNASVGQDGVHAKATASASAGVEGEAHADYELGIAKVGAEAHGMAGAEADAHAGVDIGADGGSVNAGVTAFAGAKADVGVSGEMMGVEGKVGADVRAGIGVEANVDASVSMDKVSVKLDLGVALGVGAGINVDLSFSPKELVEDVKSLWPF